MNILIDNQQWVRRSNERKDTIYNSKKVKFKYKYMHKYIMCINTGIELQESVR